MVSPGKVRGLIFNEGDRRFILKSAFVAEVLPVCKLVQLPEQPACVEGFLVDSEQAYTVLRLARLLGLPAEPIHAFSALIVLRGSAAEQRALLVDRVLDCVDLEAFDARQLNPADSFNGICERILHREASCYYELNPLALLTEDEAQRIQAYSTRAQERLSQLS